MGTKTNNYVTGDTAFAVDRRGVIVYWNEAAVDSLGYSASEALGKKCWRLLCGEDAYGNRYCCRHCPLREMAFLHEPVRSFQSTFKTNTDQPKQFSISCLTISDGPDDEFLLHVCRAENGPIGCDNNQVLIKAPDTKKLGELSQRELEVLTLLADKTKTGDIASTLSISIRTVRTHIQHVMYKLQVHKRIDAVKVGKQLKLI